MTNLNTKIQQAQRIQIGARYTNGTQTAEVIEVRPLGWVWLRNIETQEKVGYGITAFRTEWWRIG